MRRLLLAAPSAALTVPGQRQILGRQTPADQIEKMAKPKPK